MSDALPIWNCAMSEAGTPLNNLTVGAKFALHCTGDIAVEWESGPNPSAIKTVNAKKEDQMQLVVLKADKLAPNQVDFVVTSYSAGQLAPDYLRFTQSTQKNGDVGFEWSKPKWEVRSVLKQGEQPKPYPSYGPWALGFPMEILIAIGVVLLLLAAIAFRTLRRYMQRKRLREELSRHHTALLPIHQFYKDARTLRRKLDASKGPEDVKAVLAGLNQEFRLYLLRQFEIPTLEWSDPAILADLRRRHRGVYDLAADPVKLALRELSRLSLQPQVSVADVEQLHRMSMNAAERVEAAESAKPRRRR